MKIVLVCYAGMSTSLLVNKMQKIAKERAVDADIEAIPTTEIHDVVGEADVILLGPQARYVLDEIKSIADPKGIPVDVIDSVTYGMMNASAVLDKALTLYKR